MVFTYSDKKPVVQTHDWFYLSEMQFPNDGSPVYLQVGTSDKNTHVYYSVFAGNKALAKGVSKLSDEVVTRKLYYKEEYGDGVVITMAWVKNGKMYKHEVNICRPTPDNKLKLTWKTFRDKLTPGQREQWTLHIDSPEGKPAMRNCWPRCTTRASTTFQSSIGGLPLITVHRFPMRLGAADRSLSMVSMASKDTMRSMCAVSIFPFRW